MTLKVCFFVLGFIFVVMAFGTMPMSRVFPTGPNAGFGVASGLCMVAAAIADLAEKIGKSP